MSERERYTGAWATPDLIGREDLLNKIDTTLQAAGGPTVIALYGKGGIGKTRVLLDVLQRYRNDKYRPAGQLIDLYDIQYHNRLELARAIHTALDAEDDPAFREFERAVERLQRIQVSGDSKQIEEDIEKTLNECSKALRRLAESRRVIIALDTAERIAYGASETKEPFQVAQSWEWLINSLPAWSNVTLLIAGRDQITHLFPAIRQADIELTALEVTPFTEDETRAYLQAVAAAARAAGEEDVANTLDELLTRDPKRIQQIHRYSGGLPIMLALLADYISIAGFGKLPAVFETEMHPEQARPLLEAQLIERLMETSDVRDTLPMMGRAPRGLDAALLARLLKEISPEEAQKRPERIQRLSFVKVRNRLFFLHDEMYAMLRRQVFDKPGDRAEAGPVNNELIAWYDAEIKKQRQRLDGLFAPIEQPRRDPAPQPDFAEIARIRQRIDQLLIDQLYYHLRRNPQEGFREFIRLIFLAIFGGNPTLNTQIQAEMLAFLDERDPSGQQSVVDGLDRKLVEGVIAHGPVFERYAANDYENAVRKAEQLRSQQPDQTGINAAAVLVWEALARASGGMSGVDRLLEEAEKHLKPLVSSKAEDLADPRRWLARVVQALLYHTRGYVSSTRASIRAYQRAVQIWRQVDIPIYLAWTLNNLGFARVSAGDLKDGEALLREALEIRQGIGERAQVGVGYATLALALVHTGAYEQAQNYVSQALRLCRAVRYRLGEGLALRNLAEIRRRSTSRDDDPQTRLAALKEARSYVREAAFTFEGINDTRHLIEAWIEEACICRDMAGILRSHPADGEHPEELVRESVRVLTRAAKEAKSEPRSIDAWVVMASVGASVGKFEYLRQGLESVRANIPPDYEITNKGRPVPDDEKDPLLFWQLARIHIYIGNYLLNTMESTRLADLKQEYPQLAELFNAGGTTSIASPDDALAQAIRHYTLAFEYDDLYNPRHVRSQAVQDRVYNRIRTFDSRQLQRVAQAVKDIEREFGLGQSFMSRLLEGRALLLIEEDV